MSRQCTDSVRNPTFFTPHLNTVFVHPNGVSGHPDTTSGSPNGVSGHSNEVSGYPDTTSGHSNEVFRCPNTHKKAPATAVAKASQLPRVPKWIRWPKNYKIPLKKPGAMPSTSVSTASTTSVTV